MNRLRRELVLLFGSRPAMCISLSIAYWVTERKVQVSLVMYEYACNSFGTNEYMIQGCGLLAGLSWKLRVHRLGRIYRRLGPSSVNCCADFILIIRRLLSARRTGYIQKIRPNQEPCKY